MIRAATATTVTLIATVSTRLGARPASPGVRRERPISQITALKPNSGAPTSGLVLVIAAPIAANAIALLVQARVVRALARPGSERAVRRGFAGQCLASFEYRSTATATSAISPTVTARILGSWVCGSGSARLIARWLRRHSR